MDKIIKKIKNINEMAYIFIVPVQYENDINKNELVFYVANELKKFEKIYSKLFILDIVNNGIAFDKEFKDKYCVGFHPNPMGYYLIALMFGNYIDYIIRHNINLFIESNPEIASSNLAPATIVSLLSTRVFFIIIYRRICNL